MFARSAATDPLTQGDVIEDCPLVGLNLAVLPLDFTDPATKWWTARVIVLTQACDLAQAKVESVLVARAHDAQTLVETGVLKGTVIRDHIRRHLVFGWYFLPAATGSGFAARIADRPAGCSFGSARRAGAVDQRRETRCQPGVSLSRAPGAAFRRDVHARGVAGTLRDATVNN